MVEFLLKRGAATNFSDDEPWATPLAWARKLGLVDIERILLRARCDKIGSDPLADRNEATICIL